MRFAHFAVGVIALVGAFACSQSDEMPRLTAYPTSESVATSVTQNLPSPEPEPQAQPGFVKDIEEDIKARCFYMESDVPKALVLRLARIMEKHTRQYVPTGSGAERITPGYFRAFHWPPDFYNHDHGGGTVNTETTGWDPKLLSHPFFGKPDPRKQPKRAVVLSDSIPWRLTLYGEKEVFPLYGRGIWELRAEATLDPDTCEATLERVVAGPDEIVLYPDDNT